MKFCVTCEVEKEFAQFSKKPGTTDGLQPKCKECSSEWALKYRAENPKTVSEANRRFRTRHPDRVKAYEDKRYRRDKIKRDALSRYYRESHPDEVSEYLREWREKNTEKCAEYALQRRERDPNYQRTWREQNPEKSRAGWREQGRRRRGRKAEALQDGIAVDYKGKDCLYCGRPAECIDHFFALSTHFDDRSTNKVPACNECNGSKRAGSPWTWLMSDGRPQRELQAGLYG